MALVFALACLVIVKPALDHWSEVYRGNPFEAPRTRETVRMFGGGNKVTKRTVTTKDASRSLFERSLDEGGLLVFRLGVAAVAAFLAGALVQRSIMANFAVKLGPLEVPAAQAAAEASKAAETTAVRVTELEARLARVERDLAITADSTEQALTAVSATVRSLAGGMRAAGAGEETSRPILAPCPRIRSRRSSWRRLPARSTSRRAGSAR